MPLASGTATAARPGARISIAPTNRGTRGVRARFKRSPKPRSCSAVLTSPWRRSAKRTRSGADFLAAGQPASSVTGRRGDMVSADRVRRRPDRRRVPRARRGNRRTTLLGARGPDREVVCRRQRRWRQHVRREDRQNVRRNRRADRRQGQSQRGRRVDDRIASWRCKVSPAMPRRCRTFAIARSECAAGVAGHASPDAREFAGQAANGSCSARAQRTRRSPKRLRVAGPITLTYWPAANPVEVRLATKLADSWNAENPDVQVRVQPLPAGRSSEEVLLAAIVAKATPDVSSNVSSALLARLVRATASCG